MTIRTAIKFLLLMAIGLPLLQSLLIWVGVLLRSMGDEPAASAVSRLNLGVGVVWLASLVGLILSLGLKAATEPEASPLADDDVERLP